MAYLEKIRFNWIIEAANNHKPGIRLFLTNPFDDNVDYLLSAIGESKIYKFNLRNIGEKMGYDFKYSQERGFYDLTGMTMNTIRTIFQFEDDV